MSTLLLDCGNSRVKWMFRTCKGVKTGAMVLGAEGAIEGLKEELAEECITAIAVASVRSIEASADLVAQLECCFSQKVYIAEVSKSACGLTNHYQHTEKLGVDRWLAAIAAFKRLGKAVVVVDAGSAITVDYVDNRGCYEGGFIAPGLGLLCGALQLGTEAVHFSSNYANKEMTAGLSTDEAVARGVLHMATGYIKSASSKLSVQAKQKDLTVIITGGDALQLLSVMEKKYEYIEHLVLEGLNLVFEEEVVVRL
jgi:type III pantothenate kinase